MSYIKAHNEGLHILTLEGYEAGNVLRILRKYEDETGSTDVHHIIADLAMVHPLGEEDSSQTAAELEDKCANYSAVECPHCGQYSDE